MKRNPGFPAKNNAPRFGVWQTDLLITKTRYLVNIISDKSPEEARKSWVRLRKRQSRRGGTIFMSVWLHAVAALRLARAASLR